MKILLTLLVLSYFVPVYAQVVEDDIYKENKTYTHKQVILKYAELEKEFPQNCKLIKYGKTDCGRNLHLFVLNKDGAFFPETVDRDMKVMIMINNAIHPGEPCGVDACVRLCRELLDNPKRIPENVILGIIPMFNIGGATNRSCCSRANQDGPLEYGFRGNARNLDLNRDFIKADSRNARSFIDIYQKWKPEIFVDTHTSNGADYQHVMTLITSQTDKLSPILSEYVVNDLRPDLFKSMKKSGYPMVPYMHIRGKTPLDGIQDYIETPRYSTGYTAAFNTIGFVSEAHMLKPYDERVDATYEFLRILMDKTQDDWQKIHSNKRLADKHTAEAQEFPFNFYLDTTRFDMIPFKGYKAVFEPSAISGLERMRYDREQPYDAKIKYFRYYLAKDTIDKPQYYVVPQAWSEVIRLLRHNGVFMQQIEFDTNMIVNSYYIDTLTTVTRPYEGHYLHHSVEIDKQEVDVKLYRGDYLIPMGRATDRFVMEVLEPHNVDSYFAWNFFDEILMQKEWFSAYVFEDKAVEILENNPHLQKQLETKKQEDEAFANNAWAQLYYVYTHSPFYENSHMRYPVYRIDSESDLFDGLKKK